MREVALDLHIQALALVHDGLNLVKEQTLELDNFTLLLQRQLSGLLRGEGGKKGITGLIIFTCACCKDDTVCAVERQEGSGVGEWMVLRSWLLLRGQRCG